MEQDEERSLSIATEVKPKRKSKTLAQGRIPGSGRKSKLNDEIKGLLVNLISTGVPIVHASKAIGITEDTYHHWMRRGELQPNSIYGDLRRAIEKAWSQAVATRVRQINEAAKNGDWRAAAWYLERVHSDQFGRVSIANAEIGPRITVNNVLDVSGLQGLSDDRISIINANLQRALLQGQSQLTTTYRTQGAETAEGYADAGDEGSSDFGVSDARSADLDDY